MGIIKAVNLIFDYLGMMKEDKDEISHALKGVSLDIKEGDFVAILGHNGSGKSTFAKLMNGILLPTDGTVYISNMKTDDEEHIWDIRKTAGMVFQNPDNQIIGNVVEEDVGFGPENMGVPTDEIWARVDKSLEAVGMTAYRLNPRTSFLADRSSEWRLPESWRCVRGVLFWTSLQRCWTRTAGVRSSRRSMS